MLRWSCLRRNSTGLELTWWGGGIAATWRRSAIVSWRVHLGREASTIGWSAAVGIYILGKGWRRTVFILCAVHGLLRLAVDGGMNGGGLCMFLLRVLVVALRCDLGKGTNVLVLALRICGLGVSLVVLIWRRGVDIRRQRIWVERSVVSHDN